MFLHGEADTKLSGEVEADETFIGGKARNMHAGVLFGSQRPKINRCNGHLGARRKMRTKVVPNRKKHARQSRFASTWKAGSALFIGTVWNFWNLPEKRHNGS